MSSRTSRSSSSSSSSSSTSSGHSRFGSSSSKSSQWRQKSFLRIPKRQSKSVGFLAYAAGAPQNSTVVKKLTRESPEYYNGGYVPPCDTQMFWVTNTPDYSSRSSSSSRRHRTSVGSNTYHGLPPGTRIPPVRPGPGGRPMTGMHMPGAAAATMSGARPVPPPGPVPGFQSGAARGPAGGVPAGGPRPRPPAPAAAPAGGP